MVFTGLSSDVLAQGRGQNKNKIIRKLQRVVWTVGGGFVVVDDDGRAFEGLFDVKDTWNMLPFPTQAKVEGYINYGVSAELSYTYMRLKEGMPLGNDKFLRPSTVSLFAIDLNAKYDLNELIGETRAFSPYGIGGLGYTKRSLAERKSAITANIGLGFNLWIHRGVGLNVQSIAKFALNKASSRNYLAHSIGIIYRFNMLRGYITPNRLGHRHRY